MLKFPKDFIIQPIKDEGGGGDTPTGTIVLTENGVHDVTSYANANVKIFSITESIIENTKIESSLNRVISDSVTIEQV